MKFILTTVSFCLLMLLAACAASTEGISSVQGLDIPRYMGKWYEIARYDHRFEEGMTRVSATYTLLDDGRIEVLNSGYKDGKYKEIKGKAKQPNPADPGKLKVSFFLWFYSDYYVLILDPEYRYVVIGSSSDKYLWIMSRQPDLVEDVIRDLLDQLRERGYDTAKLVYSYRQ